ncbi:MAG: shikimate kinase [Pseudomonadota bacterium]
MISPLPRGPHIQLTRPLVLVGLMGVGKTTVGRRLAKQLKVPFFDADEEIEKASDMKVADFFETYGEAEFRVGERKVIERLLNQGPHVMATGGGAFMNDATRALVHEKATSLWLKADLETLVERTSQRNTRPLLNQGDPKEILGKLLVERSPIYAQADLTVESKDDSHTKTVEDILNALQKYEQNGHQL